MKPQLVFLLYVNRSGSTFLASQVARYDGMAVSVESSFLCSLLARGISVVRNQTELKSAIDVVYDDPSFQNWEIDKSELLNDLVARPLPMTVETLLRAILDHYPSTDGNINAWLLKIPALSHYVPTVRSAIPGAKFIHVVRDPRAVISSQARSRSSNTGMAMSINPATSAARWRKLVRTLHGQHGPDFLEVRYEDLVTEYDRTIQTVIDFIGGSGLPPKLGNAGDVGSYYGKIPAAQRHLHANVAKGRPMPKRIDGWRTELEPTDIHIVQNSLRPEMSRLGYEAIAIPDRHRTLRRTFLRRLQNQLRSLVAAPRRYLRYASDPRVLKTKLATKLFELKHS